MNINKYQGSQSGIEHIVLIYFFSKNPLCQSQTLLDLKISLFTGLWKSKPFLDIPKPTFKRSFKSSSSKTATPKGRANVSMEQKMDFEKYKAILRGEGPYLYTVRSPTSPQRTPIFARSKGSYAPAAIER